MLQLGGRQPDGSPRALEDIFKDTSASQDWLVSVPSEMCSLLWGDPQGLAVVCDIHSLHCPAGRPWGLDLAEVGYLPSQPLS